MSPTLFNRYINELVNLLTPLCKVYYYADDLCLLIKGLKNVKKAIKIVENWCTQNNMKLNHNKCGIITLGDRYALSKDEVERS